MHKKGFSLVELSIVVLVIGAILILVARGRHLIENVRIKKDVASIMRLQNAVYEYKTVFGGSLPIDNASQGMVNLACLIMDTNTQNTSGQGCSDNKALNLLTENDIYSSLSKRFWGVYLCDKNYKTARLYEGSGASLCAGMIGTSKDSTNSAMSLRLICGIETTMDYESFAPGTKWYSTGLGRVGGYDISSTDYDSFQLDEKLSEDQYSNCFLVDSADKMHYLYRIGEEPSL